VERNWESEREDAESYKWGWSLWGEKRWNKGESLDRVAGGRDGGRMGREGEEREGARGDLWQALSSNEIARCSFLEGGVRGGGNRVGLNGGSRLLEVPAVPVEEPAAGCRVARCTIHRQSRGAITSRQLCIRGILWRTFNRAPLPPFWILPSCRLSLVREIRGRFSYVRTLRVINSTCVLRTHKWFEY